MNENTNLTYYRERLMVQARDKYRNLHEEEIK